MPGGSPGKHLDVFLEQEVFVGHIYIYIYIQRVSYRFTSFFQSLPAVLLRPSTSGAAKGLVLISYLLSIGEQPCVRIESVPSLLAICYRVTLVLPGLSG